MLAGHCKCYGFAKGIGIKILKDGAGSCVHSGGAQLKRKQPLQSPACPENGMRANGSACCMAQLRLRPLIDCLSRADFRICSGLALTPNFSSRITNWGSFRVYLYDNRTRPLKAEETRKASGTVLIGDSEDAPKINQGPGKRKETLETDRAMG